VWDVNAGRLRRHLVNDWFRRTLMNFYGRMLASGGLA